MRPEVSVVIAAYNANPFVRRAIASVREQTFSDWEIVVVDDASTDGTDAIVESLMAEDGRIRLLRHERNEGPATARNTALAAARGRWIALLDADDAWRPERLARLLAAAAETGTELVADNQILYDEGAGREVGVALDAAELQGGITLERLLASQHAGAFHLGLLKPMILRSFLTDRNLGYRAGLRYVEDLAFYAELLLAGIRIAVVPQPYYVYTRPVGALSGRRSQQSRTVASFETLLWVADDLLTRHAGKLSQDELREIESLKKWAGRRLFTRQVTSLRHDRKYLHVALLGLYRPAAALGYIAHSRTFKSLVGKAAQRAS